MNKVYEQARSPALNHRITKNPTYQNSSETSGDKNKKNEPVKEQIKCLLLTTKLEDKNKIKNFKGLISPV